jgi:hypothetical protein
VDLLGEARDKPLPDTHRFSKLPSTRARLVSLREELLDDLRVSPIRSTTRTKVCFEPGYSRPDSRPVSPTSPAGAPLSPSSVKKYGVYMGFTMSILLRNLSRISEEFELSCKSHFLRRLQHISNGQRAVTSFRALLERKRLNVIFHTFQRMKPQVRESPRITEGHRSIFPLAEPSELINIPLILSLDRQHLGRFAGLGKLVGVLLSVIRFLKLEAVQRLSVNSLSRNK